MLSRHGYTINLDLVVFGKMMQQPLLTRFFCTNASSSRTVDDEDGDGNIQADVSDGDDDLAPTKRACSAPYRDHRVDSILRDCASLSG